MTKPPLELVKSQTSPDPLPNAKTALEYALWILRDIDLTNERVTSIAIAGAAFRNDDCPVQGNLLDVIRETLESTANFTELRRMIKILAVRAGVEVEAAP